MLGLGSVSVMRITARRPAASLPASVAIECSQSCFHPELPVGERRANGHGYVRPRLRDTNGCILVTKQTVNRFSNRLYRVNGVSHFH